MQPRAILETCLYADDLDAARDFYQQVIGLECIAAHPGRHAFFRCGTAMLLLFNPTETAKGGLATPHGAHGPGHVAFTIGPDEFDAWRAKLAAHGVPIEDERAWQPGALSLYFRDPSGNSVELTTPATWGLAE